MSTLYVPTGTELREATSEEVSARAQALISHRFHTGSKPLSNPDLAGAYLRLYLGPLDYEVSGLLHLDTHHRLITAEDMFRGAMDNATVHPREIAQSVLIHRTHRSFSTTTSGMAEPSPADEAITRKNARFSIFSTLRSSTT